jgi:2-polyprenyl-6-methoxyphenol hydroxylase-like FAD-dependent oxidoreductase
VRSRKIVIVGGGPGGLFLARLLRLRDRRIEVAVKERNPPDATFGFGVVFSDRTLENVARADRPTHDRLVAASENWSDMELRYEGASQRVGGFGFTAIARKTLLRILQEQAAEVGATLHFHTEAGLDDRADADVLVAGDGVNSTVRAALAGELGATEQLGRAKYAWFGTEARFDAVTFPFVRTEHGMFAAHAYPFDPDTSTFIVEVDEGSWRAAGMEASAQSARLPGQSDLHAKRYLERAFSEHLGGRELLVNNSKWLNFRVVDNERWHHRDVVLLGDAAHTAHFSVGSGTKLAMEDAMALSQALTGYGDLQEAFLAYERARRPAVARTQSWAAPSQRWWETFGSRRTAPLPTFAFHFLTRTGAMTYAGLRRRDEAAVDAAEREFSGRAGGGALGVPVDLGAVQASNRVVAVAAGDDTAAAFARAGAGMVIMPSPSTREAVRAVRQAGALAVSHVSPGDVGAVIEAQAAGCDAVEVGTCDPRLDAHGIRAQLAATPLAVFLLLEPPVLDPWAEQSEALVQAVNDLAAAGLGGVRVVARQRDFSAAERSPLPCLPGLGLADRIRTETGVLVALTAPTGWAVEPPPAAGREPWLTQAHVALVSGRVDLLATWPLALAPSIAAPADASQLSLILEPPTAQEV